MSEKLATAYVGIMSRAEPFMRGMAGLRQQIGRELSEVSRMVGTGWQQLVPVDDAAVVPR